MKTPSIWPWTMIRSLEAQRDVARREAALHALARKQTDAWWEKAARNWELACRSCPLRAGRSNEAQGPMPAGDTEPLPIAPLF